MFGGFMFAATSFWDMFASGGAFNPGTVLLWCIMFASPDIIDSWAAFTCECVVVCATFASPENAFC